MCIMKRPRLDGACVYFPKASLELSGTGSLRNFGGEIASLLVDTFAKLIPHEPRDLDWGAEACLRLFQGLGDGLGGIVNIDLIEQTSFPGKTLQAGLDDLLHDVGRSAGVLLRQDCLLALQRFGR